MLADNTVWMPAAPITDDQHHIMFITNDSLFFIHLCISIHCICSIFKNGRSNNHVTEWQWNACSSAVSATWTHHNEKLSAIHAYLLTSMDILLHEYWNVLTASWRSALKQDLGLACHARASAAVATVRQQYTLQRDHLHCNWWQTEAAMMLKS